MTEKHITRMSLEEIRATQSKTDWDRFRKSDQTDDASDFPLDRETAELVTRVEKS